MTIADGVIEILQDDPFIGRGGQLQVSVALEFPMND
jgi:hypothetical protein